MQMKTNELLLSYVDALRPIIYMKHFDFTYTDKIISDIGKDKNIVEFDYAFGIVNFYDKQPIEECSLEDFLINTWEEGFERETFFVVKNIHNDLENPKVISLLTRISEKQLKDNDYSATVFIVSDVINIPKEIENFITIFEVPLPTKNEISKIIDSFVDDLKIEVEKDVIKEIALSLKGLNEFQIKQILNLAYQDGGTIDRKDKALILKEKEQLIKKSGMLEIVNFSESIENIGGLDTLKEWLNNKAKIFAKLSKAIEFGVDVPKGVMIVGMPGCGKSLTAKATAALFDIPLVRLDIGRLLGKYVGESENNMRKALQLAEAISPCVLWIDELEKAFAGVGSNSGNEVTTRLFGQFLTWMQEKDNTVFIVATANDISHIPPEFLRKGRFDEIFLVELPYREECKNILEIHLKKRNKWNYDIVLDKIFPKDYDAKSNGKRFSGADIEAIVKEAIEKAFIDDKEKITTDDLIHAKENTKAISETLKEKIEIIRKTTENMAIKDANEPVKSN